MAASRRVYRADRPGGKPTPEPMGQRGGIAFGNDGVPQEATRRYAARLVGIAGARRQSAVLLFRDRLGCAVATGLCNESCCAANTSVTPPICLLNRGTTGPQLASKLTLEAKVNARQRTIALTLPVKRRHGPDPVRVRLGVITLYHRLFWRCGSVGSPS